MYQILSPRSFIAPRAAPIYRPEGGAHSRHACDSDARHAYELRCAEIYAVPSGLECFATFSASLMTSQMRSSTSSMPRSCMRVSAHAASHSRQRSRGLPPRATAPRSTRRWSGAAPGRNTRGRRNRVLATVPARRRCGGCGGLVAGLRRERAGGRHHARRLSRRAGAPPVACGSEREHDRAAQRRAAVGVRARARCLRGAQCCLSAPVNSCNRVALPRVLSL